MRLRLVLAITAALLVAIGAVAGTVALFTAKTSAAEPIYTAAELKMNSWRDQGDTVPGPMFYTTADEGKTPGGVPGRFPTGFWLPGDQYTRVLMIKNTGSADAWLTSVGAVLQAGSSEYLAKKLQVKVTADAGGADVLAQGALFDFVAGKAFAHRIALPVSPAPKPLYFTVSLPLAADNTYQELPLRVDFSVSAEQMKNNP